MNRNTTPNDALEVAREIAGECVGVRVRMLNRLTSRIFDEHLRPHGIKFSQMNILTVVALNAPIQPIEVARKLSMEKSTLSRNLRILEDNGWIESRSGASGNTLLLRLTSAGEQLLKSAAPAWREAQEAVKKALGERSTSAIRGAANRLRKLDGL